MSVKCSDCGKMVNQVVPVDYARGKPRFLCRECFLKDCKSKLDVKIKGNHVSITDDPIKINQIFEKNKVKTINIKGEIKED